MALQLDVGCALAIAFVLAGCSSTAENEMVPIIDPPASPSFELPGRLHGNFTCPDTGEFSVKEQQPQAFHARTYPEDPKKLAVSLAIEAIEVKQGANPKFTMTVRNLLNKLVYVVGPPMTNSEHASEVIVLKNGKRAEVPVAIGHWPFVQDKDYVPLSPGSSMTVKLDTLYFYNLLEPGEYEAYVVYLPDPRNQELKISSPKVSFRVVK